MSKENVALFIKAANKNQDLIRQITTKDRTADWVAIAQKAGYLPPPNLRRSCPTPWVDQRRQITRSASTCWRRRQWPRVN